MTASSRERVVALVTEFAPEPPPGEVQDSFDFLDDLGFHSLALVELSFAVEDEFALEPITAEDVEDVRTVGDLVAFLDQRLGAGDGADQLEAEAADRLS